MPDQVDDKVLPLQEWLKALTSHGVPMRVAMQLAAKTYKDYNTRTSLANLESDKLNEAVPDKDQRKLVINALRNLSIGKSTSKKRSRDDDLLLPLAPDKATIAKSFDFNEVLDPEQLLPVSVTVNRAPIKTAWAYSVARRRGFDVQESLSLAHVYVHIGSLKHALALGNILDAEQTRDAEEEIRELPGEASYRRPGTSPQKRKWEAVVEKPVGSSQPWVGLLRSRIPVIEREDGTWRALQKGVPVEPSLAYLYITRALKTFTGHVMGAMKLVVDSYPPDEIEAVGLHLYNEFKPDVTGWGQRGSVDVAKILDQIKAPIDEEKPAGVEAGISEEAKHEDPRTPENVNPGVEVTKDDSEPPKKKQKDMTLEEYEEMLDGDDIWDNVDLSAIP